MKRIILALSIFALSLPGCSDRKTESLDYEALNRQARQDYLFPVRPGYEGVNPFWNEFAVKFIYAPAFDFKEFDARDSFYTPGVVEQYQWRAVVDASVAGVA